MVDLTKTVYIVPQRHSAANASNTMKLDLRDPSVAPEPATAVLDWSNAKELHTQLLELCARDGLPHDTNNAQDAASTLRDAALSAESPRAALTAESPRAALSAESPRATPSAESVPCEAPPLNVVTTVRFVAAAVPNAERKPELGNTLVLSPGATGLDSTIYDGGALRDYALKLAADAQAAPKPEPGATEPAARGLRRLLRRETRLRVVGALDARLRAVPWSRRLVIVLLPAAVVLGAAGKLPLGPSQQSQNDVERVPAVAHATPIPPQQNSRLKRTAAVKGAAIEIAPSKVPITPPPQEPVPAAAPDPTLERTALRAAFDGNRPEAIAAYERLAQTSGGESFALAARLLREGQVRKP